MKLLKIIVIPAIVCFFSLTLLQAQDLQTPMPSPTGTITQLVGLTEVSISYSRPGVKGREIFGNLVPYGVAGPVEVPQAQLPVQRPALDPEGRAEQAPPRAARKASASRSARSATRPPRPSAAASRSA